MAGSEYTIEHANIRVIPDRSVADLKMRFAEFANCGIPASHFKQGYSPDPSSSGQKGLGSRLHFHKALNAQSSIPPFSFINIKEQKGALECQM